MRSARFDMALRGNAALHSAGSIVVYGPQIGDDLGAWPRQAVSVVTAFKPDYDHFTRAGYRVVARAGDAPLADLAIVCLPRAKPAARDLLAQAAGRLRAGGQIVLDGQKTDGIGAVLRDLADLGTDLGEVISKSHGKLALFRPPIGLADWAARPQTVDGGFVTRAGVFSADGADRGSQLLAAALPATLPARVADFGAGWGYLSRAILARSGVRHLDLIEADAQALDCARQNTPDPRAAFHWADVASHRPAALWDCVVTNPPFHTSRSANPALGLAFVTAAHARLAPHGQLWLVANRQLPYMDPIRALFREVEELGRDPAFRLIRAAFPQRAR